MTTAWWKEERGQRIFVDFNQANRDRTMAGAYSPRALPGATVSTPIAWDELDEVDPTRFTVRTVPRRLADIGGPVGEHAGRSGGADRYAAGLVGARRGGRARRDAVPPPEFPKMPGEPPRVQPSKKVAANWDENGEPR